MIDNDNDWRRWYIRRNDSPFYMRFSGYVLLLAWYLASLWPFCVNLRASVAWAWMEESRNGRTGLSFTTDFGWCACLPIVEQWSSLHLMHLTKLTGMFWLCHWPLLIFNPPNATFLCISNDQNSRHSKDRCGLVLRRKPSLTVWCSMSSKCSCPEPTIERGR